MVGAVIGQVKYTWLGDDEGATLTSGAGTMLTPETRAELNLILFYLKPYNPH